MHAYSVLKIWKANFGTFPEKNRRWQECLTFHLEQDHFFSAFVDMGMPVLSSLSFTFFSMNSIWQRQKANHKVKGKGAREICSYGAISKKKARIETRELFLQVPI